MVNVKYAYFGGETSREGTVGRRMRRWENNIKMDFRQMGCEGMNWIQLTQDRIH
jgi:hypothetical protein